LLKVGPLEVGQSLVGPTFNNIRPALPSEAGAKDGTSFLN